MKYFTGSTMSLGPALGLALLLATAGNLQAATLLVPGQFATIQDAIQASVTGDVVLVSPGFYLENLTSGQFDVARVQIMDGKTELFKHEPAPGSPIRQTAAYGCDLLWPHFVPLPLDRPLMFRMWLVCGKDCERSQSWIARLLRSYVWCDGVPVLVGIEATYGYPT